MVNKIININDWRDDIISTMKRLFELDGEVSSLILFVEKEKISNELIMGAIPINHLLKDNTTKDKLGDAVAKMCKEKDVVALMLITEAWKVSRPIKEITKEELDNFSVKDASDKEECIMVTFETKISNTTYTYEIDKKNGKSTIGNETVSSNSKGRFSRFLAPQIYLN